jgi:type VII secretion-associated serine protease mycosin
VTACLPAGHAVGRVWWIFAGLRRTLAVLAAVLVVAGTGAPAARADAVRDAQWHLGYLRVAQAHRLSQGAGVTVAVIDTGVDAGHRDLSGAVLPGTDLTASPAGRRDGRTDLDGHGTAMAGLIGARGRGSRGALGIAPRARILPIRNTPSTAPTDSDLAASIDWAVAHGARVISMSLTEFEPDDDVRAAVEAARRADVVLVAAVGNAPLFEAVGYPAGYPGVLAVAGVDRRGRRADVSVTGSRVDLAAPAVDVVSTDRRGGTGYRRSTGTSDAAAIVAGAAALVRARYPDLPAGEVVRRLTATARDAGAAGRDAEYGTGVLDPVAALTADLPAAPPTTPAGAAPTGASPAPGRNPRADGGDGGTGVPVGLVIVGAGLLLLLGAVGGGALLLRRR